jgi:hypothetical protein
VLTDIDNSNAAILDIADNEHIDNIIEYGTTNHQTNHHSQRQNLQTADSKTPASVSQMSYKVSD